MTENGYYDSTYYAGCAHFLYTWTVQDFSKIDGIVNGSEFLLPGDKNCSFSLCRLLDVLRLSMISSCCSLTCDISFFSCTGVTLFRRNFMKFSDKKEHKYLYTIRLQLKEDDIKKLGGLPEDTLVIICDIRDSAVQNERFVVREGGSENGYLDYLKKLANNIKCTPDVLLEDIVSLCVGSETEIVNKAVLCSRSPVFAKMLVCDMVEKRENSVKIDDIKIEVLRGLITFLYSGIVPDCDFKFLYDLYYTANKYDISQLLDECRHLLVSKFTIENVCEILEISIMCNDDYLKFNTMLFIGSNLRRVVTTAGWKSLMTSEPKTTLKVMDFFNSGTEISFKDGHVI